MAGKADSEGPESEAEQHPEHSQCFKEPSHRKVPDRLYASSLEGKVNRSNYCLPLRWKRICTLSNVASPSVIALSMIGKKASIRSRVSTISTTIGRSVDKRRIL